MLIPDWRRVLRRAWSVRLISASAVFGALEVAIPYLEGVLPVSRGAFALLAFLASLGAGFARFLAQRSMQDEDAA